MDSKLMKRFGLAIVFLSFLSFAQFGDAPGTFSLVQSAHCNTITGSNTCSLTVSQNLAPGNLDVFMCNVPSSGSSVYNSITRVSTGGTLISAVAASTGAYGNSSLPNKEMTSYILPRTSTGGTSPIVITFAKNATASTGRCILYEWHPSQSGTAVNIDNDSMFVPQIAGTSNTNISLTQSGTNDVCSQMFAASSQGATATAVSSPYNENQFLSGTSAGGAYSMAVTGGAGPTWTSGSTIPVLGAACFGWNTLPHVPQSFNDFEAGVSGNIPTAVDLADSNHGWQGCLWNANSAGLFRYDSAASMPLLSATKRFGDGTSYSSGAGSLGLSITGTGSTSIDKLSCNFGFNISLPSITASVKWTSDVADNDPSDVDCFQINGASQYAAVNCYEGGSGHRIWRLEDTIHNGTPVITAVPSTACGSVGCTLVLTYQSGTGSVAGTMSLSVYDQTCTLLGTSSALGATTVDYPQTVSVGHFGSQKLTSGKHMYWDSLQISLSRTPPTPPC